MRILGLERDNKACNFYRVLQPLAKLQEQGLADCCLIEFNQDIASEDSFKKVLESDVILIPRPQSEEWLQFVNAVRRAGKVVVCDYDDNPFNVSPYNTYYRFSGLKEFEVVWPDGYREWLWKDGMPGPKGEKFFDIEANIHRRDMCRAAFGKSDLVTSTVEPLRSEFEKINQNSIILPNLIDMDGYPKCEMVKPTRLKIGWQGGISHFEDLEYLLPIILKFAGSNDIDFTFFGDHRLGTMFQKVPGYHHESFTSIEVYPWKLKMMNLDIGLAPLLDNEFNHCKSAIKYFEYAAVGVPTIASNVQPYSDVITNRVDGILVDKPEEWIEAMNELAADPALRKKIADNAYENVYRNYNANTQAHLWVDAYEKALQKDKVVV